jgi:uroporphyrinogen III methyltransferase/synthase
MGIERLREITHRLREEGAEAATPVALVRWGTTARQESLVGTLATIADLAEERKFKAPAITVVGDVVRLRDELNWFEALPLFGRRVVVTRARAQVGSLARRLERLGADVLEIPTIRIERIPLESSAREKLGQLGEHFDWLVFTSPNAVDLFFAEFFRACDDVRRLGAIRLAALGPATARKLAELHLRVDLQPSLFTAEKLAAAFPASAMAGERFCLPHGRLADPLLGDHLRAAGAQVEEWVLYDTMPEEADPAGTRARYLREGAHWIAFTSASTVENWQALALNPAPGAPHPAMISMGPVTTATMKKLGCPVAAESPQATLDSLVETIRRLAIDSLHGDNR